MCIHEREGRAFFYGVHSGTSYENDHLHRNPDDGGCSDHYVHLSGCAVEPADEQAAHLLWQGELQGHREAITVCLADGDSGDCSSTADEHPTAILRAALFN